MTYREIERRLELRDTDFEAESATLDLMAEVKRRTGRRPRYKDQAPDWAVEFLSKRGYRI